MKRPPAAALVLGFAGLLPPLATMAFQVFAQSQFDAYKAALVGASTGLSGLTYIALILSFLGGTWWGASAGRVTPGQLWGWLILSVVPTLIAAAALAGVWVDPEMRAHAVAAALLIAMLLSLIGDALLARARLVPDWWMTLRVPLSVLLAAEALGIAVLA